MSLFINIHLVDGNNVDPDQILSMLFSKEGTEICEKLTSTLNIVHFRLDVVVFMFNVPPTAKVIWRRGHCIKSHPTDW